MTTKPNDTEARSKWYKHGEELESLFLNTIVPRLSLPIQLNPKKQVDPTVIDFLYLSKFPADLKTQNTPFFTAKRYGVSPQYAVTFNHKDYVRYKKLYPYSLIFFWVNWTTLEWNNKRVKPMNGIWKIPFWKLVKDIEEGTVPLHRYKRRAADRRPNAKDSYILDIRRYTNIWLEEKGHHK